MYLSQQEVELKYVEFKEVKVRFPHLEKFSLNCNPC